MKKLLIYSISALLLSGCGSMDQVSRSIVATQTGAALGSIAGSIIGDNIGGYRGSYLGSFVGSAARCHDWRKYYCSKTAGRKQIEKRLFVSNVISGSRYSRIFVCKDEKLEQNKWKP